LCWLVCRTAPNAIRWSLGGGARLPRAANPSPRNDASATALRGAFEASVRILLSNILMPGDGVFFGGLRVGCVCLLGGVSGLSPACVCTRRECVCVCVGVCVEARERDREERVNPTYTLNGKRT